MSLQLGSSGPSVTDLQQRLQQHGFYTGTIDGQFGPGTEAAVQAFQNSVGLAADGKAGANTLAALTMPSVTSNVTLDVVAPMFPATPRVNIQFHLPFVLKALLDATLADKSMVLMALGTIRAETGSFLPIDEFESQFNTPPGGPPYALYDNRADLGNQGPPDGANFKGRGFIQLTGRNNYTKFSQVIGLGDQLVQNPDLANDPDIAAKLLAAFLRAKATQIRQALQINDLATARKLVNGGTHGLADFEDAFNRGQPLIPDPVQVSVG
ncbi:MAG TPA: peptidoglycan-binding protein [Terriglobia bacterium]|nr:peptidoglycan-binding protein [Terriglobia bacterium]